jgi:hypothetical protein
MDTIEVLTKLRGEVDALTCGLSAKYGVIGKGDVLGLIDAAIECTAVAPTVLVLPHKYGMSAGKGGDGGEASEVGAEDVATVVATEMRALEIAMLMETHSKAELAAKAEQLGVSTLGNKGEIAARVWDAQNPEDNAD